MDVVDCVRALYYPLCTSCNGTGNHLLGWVVTFLVDIRQGNLKNVGFVASGYFGGAFLGRLILAEPTHRWGERKMVLLYAVLCLAMQLCFWL